MNEQILLNIGSEGGGSLVEKITVNGKEIIRASSDYCDITEECGDTYGKKDYNTFEEFWNEFIKNDFWVNLHPLFIHKDCREIIRKSVKEKYLKGLTEFQKFQIMEWERWLDLKEWIG